MALVQINGMTFYANHGCFDEELITGNQFIVDISFECDTTQAELTDNLKETVDYQEVYKIIKHQMATPSKLIEHVGRRILDAVRESYPELINISVKVAKCHPPVGGKVDSVSVVIR